MARTKPAAGKKKSTDGSIWHITRSEFTDGDSFGSCLPEMTFGEHPNFHAYFASLIHCVHTSRTPTAYDKTKASRIVYFNNMVFQLKQEFKGLEECHEWLFETTPAFSRALQFKMNKILRPETLETLVDIIQQIEPHFSDILLSDIRRYEKNIDDYLNIEFKKKFGASLHADLFRLFYESDGITLKPTAMRPTAFNK